MYIHKIYLRNIRGFHGTKNPISLDLARPDGSHAGWTVVTGRNGNGKSSFLRAISLAIAGPSVARALMPDLEGWISQGESTAEVAVSFAVGPQDSLSGSGALPKAQTWAGLRWRRSDDGPRPTMSAFAPTGSVRTAERGPWSENPTGWFFAGYGPFRRLSGAAAEAQRLMQSNTRSASLVTLFDETASLAESTWWLQELYPKALEGDERAKKLIDDILALLNDGLLPDGTRALEYNSNGLWIEQGGVKLVLAEMSDGYRVVAALVIDLVRRLHGAYGHFNLGKDESGRTWTEHQGVVLIDEVDVHLHISWQQRIGFWMVAHFPNVQFIVSSHSPFICQAASENGLIRLAAIGEGDRHPEMITGGLFDAIVNGDADRVAMSSMFGMNSTYSPSTLEKRARWEELEVKSVTGAEENERDALREELAIGPSDDIRIALTELTDALKEADA